MGDARNLLMALAGDACLVIGGRAGTRDERGNSRILTWSSMADLERNLRELGLVGSPID